MIDINLIPTALRKDGDQGSAVNLPKEMLVGVGAGVVFLMIIVHLILGVIWIIDMGGLARYNAEWQKVMPERTVLDAIYKESGDLKKKITTLSDFTLNKSVLWSPKFNAISDSVPQGVWIRRMTLDKVGVTIEGSVVSKSQNEINSVGKFVNALRQNDNFMKGIVALEVNSIQGTKSNAVDVTDFSVLAKLNEALTKTNEPVKRK